MLSLVKHTFSLAFYIWLILAEHFCSETKTLPKTCNSLSSHFWWCDIEPKTTNQIIKHVNAPVKGVISAQGSAHWVRRDPRIIPHFAPGFWLPSRTGPAGCCSPGRIGPGAPGRAMSKSLRDSNRRTLAPQRCFGGGLWEQRRYLHKHSDTERPDAPARGEEI